MSERRCTLKLNGGLPFRCHRLSLAGGERMCGVRLAQRGDEVVYQVNSTALQRRISLAQVHETVEITLPSARGLGMALKSAQAGMIGKHKRAVYQDPASETCGVYVARAGVPAVEQELRPLLAHGLRLSQPPGHDRVLAEVPREAWPDLRVLLGRCRLEYALRDGDFAPSQYAPEKLDRDTELFDIPADADLDSRTDPNVVGPSWRSTVEKYWCTGEFPEPFVDIRTYTWQQLAKVCYEMLRCDPVSIENRCLVFPEPFASYMLERVYAEYSRPPFVKAKTRSQPQLSAAQIEQLYDASSLVHRAKMQPTVIDPPTADQVACAKVVLMLYRMRGFYVRKTRMYVKTGRTSRFKGGTRKWKDERTREIYSDLENVKEQTLGALVEDLSGDFVPHTTAEYRGKYRSAQPAGTPIYVALRKRRNTVGNDVSRAKRIRDQLTAEG